MLIIGASPADIKNNTLKSLVFPIGTQYALCLSIIQLPLVLIGSFLLICYQNRFNVEKPSHNPLWIYKVLKPYAWKHNCPQNRSAFTYWKIIFLLALTLARTCMEDHSPLRRWRIPCHSLLFLLFTLYILGFHLSGHGYSSVKQLMKVQCPSLWLYIKIADPNSLPPL